MRRLALAALAASLLLPACNDSSPRPAPSAAPPTTSAAPSTPAATGTPSSLAATIERFGKAGVRWKGCGGGFECADLRVPLDYDAPDGDTIEVSVIRLKARRSARRIGSLVLNPGGPGGSGIEFARQAEALLPGEVRDRFDVVSFDPRGVGESTPVDCLNDAELDRLLAVDPSPETAAEKKALFDASRDQVAKCKARAGRLLPHVGTVDVAKDMDVLRVALGDAKLTYVGFSYGTLLGARYAEQFPTHVRALVLDGALDPTLTPRETAKAQAVGFDRALEAFFTDCVSSSCAFASHGDIHATYDRLMADIDRSPLRAGADAGRTVGPSEALFGVAAALYSREYGWPLLRTALEQAYSRRDGSGLLSLFDSLVERDDNGHFSNSVEAQASVLCVDNTHERSEAAYDADAAAFAKVAPRFGPAIAYGASACAFWPAPPVSKPGPIHANGAPPIVVVGTIRDPATPYAWSEALARQLPGVLVTYDGDGHTAYGYQRSECIEDLVDQYLISLRVPKAGARCG
ncbi:MAG TPA: alpha/beta hydrolase [Mycobacteriales bacterium]